jgi:hypothetical protein
MYMLIAPLDGCPVQAREAAMRTATMGIERRKWAQRVSMRQAGNGRRPPIAANVRRTPPTSAGRAPHGVLRGAIACHDSVFSTDAAGIRSAGWLADLAGWPTGGCPLTATSVKPPINKRMGGRHFQLGIRLSIAPACETALAASSSVAPATSGGSRATATFSTGCGSSTLPWFRLRLGFRR